MDGGRQQMKKIAVVYWSSTGNTEEMAKAVVEGAQGAGGAVELIYATDFGEDKVQAFDAIAFGCPATGTEQLDEGEFEPMFVSLESVLVDKPVVLFGSYSWGEGDWMRSWEELTSSYGARIVAGSVIAADTPDETALDACRALGGALVAGA